MEKPDQLSGLFPMQTAIDERLGGKKNEVSFKCPDSRCEKKQENGPQLV
jgi:hypothetical protein